MSKKARVLQPALFNIDSPPVKAMPTAPSPQEEHPTEAEKTFFRKLCESNPRLKLVFVPTTCAHCGIIYISISYHMLYVCTSSKMRPQRPQEAQSLTPPTPTGGLVSESLAVPSPLPQDETPQREPSENVPGAFAYKSKGVPEADKMHPSYRPPSASKSVGIKTGIKTDETRGSAPENVTAKAQEPVTPPEKKERPPHFWHWMRRPKPLQVMIKGKAHEIKIRTQESYTPPLSLRRRSIPAIACRLYTAVQCSVLSMQSLSGCKDSRYYSCNKIFYDEDKKKVEKYINLLVFCGLDSDRVRWWAREAWKIWRDGDYHPWSDTKAKKGKGRGLLALLGYQLDDGEDDGYSDIKLACFADFLQEDTGPQRPEGDSNDSR